MKDTAYLICIQWIGKPYERIPSAKPCVSHPALRVFCLFVCFNSWETHRETQRKKQAPHREPDVGLDPRTPGSRPEPTADAQPLSHPGVPLTCSFCLSDSSGLWSCLPTGLPPLAALRQWLIRARGGGVGKCPGSSAGWIILTCMCPSRIKPVALSGLWLESCDD